MKKTSKWGVIPYKYDSKGCVKFLLVSTLRGKWVFPKGNLIKKLGPNRTAKLEAYEEAGVAGAIWKKAFTIKVGSKKFFFFPMAVSKVFNDWPEATFRARKWVDPLEAGKLLDRKPYNRVLTMAIDTLVLDTVNISKKL